MSIGRHGPRDGGLPCIIFSLLASVSPLGMMYIHMWIKSTGANGMRQNSLSNQAQEKVGHGVSYDYTLTVAHYR